MTEHSLGRPIFVSAACVLINVIFNFSASSPEQPKCKGDKEKIFKFFYLVIEGRTKITSLGALSRHRLQ